MSRKVLAAAVFALGACSDPSAVTSPPVAGSSSAVTSASASSCSADQGQQLLDAGQYTKAIKEFTCVIDLDPTAIDGYRGRIEAQLTLGRFSDAVRDYTRVNAFVVPVHPDAEGVIVDWYQARLDVAPNDVRALMGQSYAYWWFFDYPAALHVLDHLLEVDPNNLQGNLIRGSARLLHGSNKTGGKADLERAIALAPTNPHVRFIVADAYTYGAEPDAQRAFDEATRALNGGLDTPRIRAILAASYNAFGQLAAAAVQIKIHLDMVTTDLVAASPLAAGSSKTVAVAPGRTYEIPLPVAAGESVSIMTSSKDLWDTILVLLAPDGTPVVGSDDYKAYFAGFQWVAPSAGTYRLRVTSFEAVSTGNILVARS